MEGYIRLRNYAEWYYLKYFPSKNFLQEKLLRREGNAELVREVIRDLDTLIVEKANIESRVHAFLSQGKTARYIRQKLLQKKFDPDLIESVLLTQSDVIENPETYRSQIERIVTRGYRKGISKKFLQYELEMQYPHARDITQELLQEYDDFKILQKKAPELLGKYSQEQVIKKLSQKGFRIADIYTVLRRR